MLEEMQNSETARKKEHLILHLLSAKGTLLSDRPALVVEEPRDRHQQARHQGQCEESPVVAQRLEHRTRGCGTACC
jgi:hypothetical protein